jgi:putative CocE/NonD family hydrolase
MSDIEVIENVFIPLKDGTRLAARLWLPAQELRPAPAVLEYIPYRKRDGTRGRDEPMHGYFAAHGYASVRVDIRGSGDSDGRLVDEYLKLEQDDALEAIAWIAAQGWCDGAVAIIGKSWGGFNALQIAARRPPALKAIIPVCFTDDRYADDIHYMGGCLLNDNLWWGATMLAYQARPPDPRIVGERWRAMWRDRIESMPFWPALWLRRQRRDAYWKHGSVCEDWSGIDVPTLAIGGWADGYSNAVSRLVANIKSPALGIVGPWAHLYPHDGAPGPAIGFLQEVVRFLDHWLKGRETGVMSAPRLRAYIEEWSEPSSWRDPAPGRWVGEANWPSPSNTYRSLWLGERSLSETPQPSSDLRVRSKCYAGLAAGEWMGAGVAGEQPTDQRFDDGQSLCFDSGPMSERIELLGAPELEVDVASDSPLAQICARLTAVSPEGASRRLCFGVLNLAHRESHEHPEPLAPGRFYRIRLKLNDCGCAIPEGFRIRLGLSTAYWPMIWPSPEPAALTIRTGQSRLRLPLRPAQPDDGRIGFEPPERGRAATVDIIKAGRARREFALDLVNDVATFHVIGEGGLFGEGVQRFRETGAALSHDVTRAFFIAGDDPLTARAVVTQTYTVDQPGLEARIETEVELSCDATYFRIAGRLDAHENGAQFATRRFDERIARDMV